MDDHGDNYLSLELELLSQTTDPDPVENNLSAIFGSNNTNNTTINFNNLADNTFSLHHADLFAPPAVNIPITSNMAPSMIPTPVNPFSFDHASTFTPAPLNVPITTTNMAPVMIPAPVIPIPTPNPSPYTATYYNDSFPQTQNAAMWPSQPTQNTPIWSTLPTENPVFWSSSQSQNPAVWSSPIPNPENWSSAPIHNSPAMSSPAMLTPPSITVVETTPPNWGAINAYLNGQVRPGADGERVYKCHKCGTEFTNPQALGGHMGSHKKRPEGTSKSGSSKKPRRR